MHAPCLLTLPKWLAPLGCRCSACLGSSQDRTSFSATQRLSRKEPVGMLVQVCSAGNFTWELPGWCVLYSLPCRAADHFLAKMETSLCIIFFFFLQLLKSFSVAGLLRSYRAAFKTFKTVGQIYKTTEMKNHRAEGSYTFISMLCLRSCLVVFHCLENFLPAVIPEVSPGKRKVKQGRFSFPFLSLCLLLKTDTHKPPCTFSANGRTHNTVEAGSL